MDVHTEADRLAEEVNLIDEINSSARFSQMKIYTDNFKYEKALAVIDQIYAEYREEGEPNTLTFILKQKYLI